MKKQLLISALLLFVTFFTTLLAQDIQLPTPVKTGGMPLMEALSKRASTREYSQKVLDNQTLSNLLWAAWGYNRDGKRTAPSSRNLQEIELYVILKSGAYIYDAKNNILTQVTTNDIRKLTGSQDFVATAPLHIAFVANTEKGSSMETSHANAGFISQNIYLFCASYSLSTVIRASFDENKLSKALNLTDKRKPIYVQTIGGKK